MRARRIPYKLEPNGIVQEDSHIQGFEYRGGPIVKCPQIYTSYCSHGGFYNKSMADYLNESFRNLLNSNFMNVLSQYGAGRGVFVQDTYLSIGGAVAPLTDSNIQTLILALIQGGGLPEPGKSGQNNTVFMIFLDETLQFKDPIQGEFCALNGSFGYHSFFITPKGNSCYYAVISNCTDDCVKKACCSNYPDCTSISPECALDPTKLTLPQRLTTVASHEFAELVTDPENPRSDGWYSPTFGEWEVGDICEGYSEILAVGNEYVTVQKIYSKVDDTSIDSNQDNYCLGQAASPKPPISPGPHAITQAVRERMRIASFERFLPLPSVYVDMSTNVVSRDREEVHRYIKKIFHPLRHEDIFSDFPEFLHQVANVLATKEELDT